MHLHFADGCPEDIICPGEGFVDKDCHCWCPDSNGRSIVRCEGEL